jgi:hypothetical protein
MCVAVERYKLTFVYRPGDQWMWRKLGTGIEREEKKKENQGEKKNSTPMGTHAKLLPGMPDHRFNCTLDRVGGGEVPATLVRRILLFQLRPRQAVFR